MNREILMELVKIVLMVVSVLVTSYVIPWIKANTNNAKMHTLLNWVEQGVHAAEQIYGAKSGEEKREYVVRWMKLIAADNNINITDQELHMLIEAAVKAMNSEDYIMVKPEDYEAITETE